MLPRHRPPCHVRRARVNWPVVQLIPNRLWVTVRCPAYRHPRVGLGDCTTFTPNRVDMTMLRQLRLVRAADPKGGIKFTTND
jgi:hypothetical protein